MNNTPMSAGKAELVLARLIGLAVAITLCFAFLFTLVDGGFMVMDLLSILLICMAPPAATLALLFAGQRRIVGYVALLGAMPCTALFLLAIAPVAAYGWPSIWQLVNVLISLPFFYTAITMARVSVGVRVPSGKQRRAQQLRANRRAIALTLGPPKEHQGLPDAHRDKDNPHP